MTSVFFISPGILPTRSSINSRISSPRHETWNSPQRHRVHAEATTPSNQALSTESHRYEDISWSQVEHMCKQLAETVKPERFDVVLAITRGGLIPASLLCEVFELRTLLSATVIFYTDTGEQFFGMAEPRFLSFPNADALEGRRVLIVDDIWDTGRTANAVKERVSRASPKLVKVAVLHFKSDMNLFPGEEPDFYCQITPNWVLYPWDRASPLSPQIDPEASVSSCVPNDENDERTTDVAGIVM